MTNSTKSTISRRRLSTALCLALAPSLLATGCATLRDSAPMKLARKIDIPNGIPWKHQEHREGDPRKMVVTWTDAVRHQSGAGAERGFGGRIFFYDRDESDPIKVDGQLVVYAFDETDRLPTDNRPTKRYVFPAEQFVKHVSESELGVSYSVWLPWDATGGAATDVSLIARFEPNAGGNLVVSEQTRQRLPGAMDPIDTMIAGQENRPQVTRVASTQPIGAGQATVTNAGYQSTPPMPAVGAIKHSGMETTTIKLPSRPRRFTN
ncbi:hypothetical protein KOR34_00450 [Posidoniimonas corsicana]|uniref:Uncharacterized protein n=1 Tax=Posidoniimonas corsicana TaxID=1938618 RepID=A0A5C5V9C1_9BACT|nr:hypothetical protein [Posidoniimonas corsicana]TWT35158.1 hypothetical protein KOR34_00450 [Posidoniimonas corsicana]